MMPASAMRPEIKAALEETDHLSWHLGRRLDCVARRIAHENDHRKYLVRARLIQLGHVMAKGALNYVDDRYIEPFAFSVEKGTGDYTFVIDKKTAFAEYASNPDFRAYLDSGAFLYADGHLCLNDPKYVVFTSSGARLTLLQMPEGVALSSSFLCEQSLCRERVAFRKYLKTVLTASKLRVYTQLNDTSFYANVL